MIDDLINGVNKGYLFKYDKVEQSKKKKRALH